MNTGLIILSWGICAALAVAVLLKSGILTIEIEREHESDHDRGGDSQRDDDKGK